MAAMSRESKTPASASASASASTPAPAQRTICLPRMATEAVPGTANPPDLENTRSSKFRFKSKRKSSADHDSDDYQKDESRSKRRKHEHSPSSHHHRRSRRKRSYASPLKDDPARYDDSYQPNARSSQYMDPETAFRESLFDALADDEGAAYWEGVYGQPIHVFPDKKVGPDGELERMTDEEYAEHVRKRMWEKSHEHIMEERRLREESHKKERERERQRRREEPDRVGFDSRIDEALRRGENRKKDRQWKEHWLQYTTKWERLLQGAAASTEQEPKDDTVIPLIPWPVDTGKRKDITKEAVETFFHKTRPGELEAVLKVERVRWHPDKMQHRFRGRSLDSDTLQAVTAVFQIVDTMWKGLK